MELVLDNNSLFSIINPNSTSAYLFSSIRVKFIDSEINKYKDICFSKANISEHEFEVIYSEIKKSIKFFKISEYEKFLKIAQSSISDINDIDFLALALYKNASIWSNDPHLKEQSLIPVFTTKELLKMFLNNDI